MKTVFADTFYYLAFTSEDDASHTRAVEFSRSFIGRIVTTAWVLTEVGDALAAPRHRGVFITLLKSLHRDPHLVIVPPTKDLFERGIDLYSRRPDKAWTLTDCISFVVMGNQEITVAA